MIKTVAGLAVIATLTAAQQVSALRSKAFFRSHSWTEVTVRMGSEPASQHQKRGTSGGI